MVDTLESKGIMIISTLVEADKQFDGLAGNIDNTPVVVISTQLPGDRQRFTLAHELGHLVLHGRLAEEIDEERACNQFAGAFLLPRQGVFQHLGSNRRALEVQELYMLKQEYGISMMATLVRAGQCGTISDICFTIGIKPKVKLPVADAPIEDNNLPWEEFVVPQERKLIDHGIVIERKEPEFWTKVA